MGNLSLKQFLTLISKTPFLIFSLLYIYLFLSVVVDDDFYVFFFLFFFFISIYFCQLQLRFWEDCYFVLLLFFVLFWKRCFWFCSLFSVLFYFIFVLFRFYCFFCLFVCLLVFFCFLFFFCFVCSLIFLFSFFLTTNIVTEHKTKDDNFKETLNCYNKNL